MCLLLALARRPCGAAPASRTAAVPQPQPDARSCLCAPRPDVLQPVTTCRPLPGLLFPSSLTTAPSPPPAPASPSMAGTLTPDAVFSCGQAQSAHQPDRLFHVTSGESPSDGGVTCRAPRLCPSLPSARRPRRVLVTATAGFRVAPAPGEGARGAWPHGQRKPGHTFRLPDFRALFPCALSCVWRGPGTRVLSLGAQTPSPSPVGRPFSMHLPLPWGRHPLASAGSLSPLPSPKACEPRAKRDRSSRLTALSSCFLLSYSERPGASSLNLVPTSWQRDKVSEHRGVSVTSRTSSGTRGEQVWKQLLGLRQRLVNSRIRWRQVTDVRAGVGLSLRGHRRGLRIHSVRPCSEAG